MLDTNLRISIAHVMVPHISIYLFLIIYQLQNVIFCNHIKNVIFLIRFQTLTSSRSVIFIYLRKLRHLHGRCETQCPSRKAPKLVRVTGTRKASGDF